jgi:hypothetical protein
MSLHRLTPHPDTPCSGISRIEVELEHDVLGLRLCYRMSGDADRVVVASRERGASPRRCDGLWTGTCCELFMADAGEAGYREYNFAPSGDWAAYRFDAYRSGRAALETCGPRIAFERRPAMLELTVTLTDLRCAGALRIGVACVVETDAELSYWALAHPPGRPDFHDPSAFALTLAAARAARAPA